MVYVDKRSKTAGHPIFYCGKHVYTQKRHTAIAAQSMLKVEVEKGRPTCYGRFSCSARLWLEKAWRQMYPYKKGRTALANPPTLKFLWGSLQSRHFDRATCTNSSIHVDKGCYAVCHPSFCQLHNATTILPLPSVAGLAVVCIT